MPSDVRAQPIFWFTRNFGLHKILGILEILGCTYWLLKKRKSDVVTACLELQFLHQPQSFIRGHVSPPRRENCIKPRQMMHSFMLCIFRKYLKVFKSFICSSTSTAWRGKQEKGHFRVPVHVWEMNFCKVPRKRIIFEFAFLSLKEKCLFRNGCDISRFCHNCTSSGTCSIYFISIFAPHFILFFSNFTST